MTTLTINVDSHVEQKFRKQAQFQYHNKKGYLGDAITEAMKKWLYDRQQKEIVEQALTDLRAGWKTGKILYRHRDELYDR